MAQLLTLAISGYRSLRDVVVPLAPLTVITGANGSGKSSFYKALKLLADVAQGRALGALASEGGLASTLWAGPEVISQAMRRADVPVQGTVRKGPVALRLGFASEDYGYAIDLGLPPPVPRTMFVQDPEIKAEALWVGASMRRSNVLVTRKGPAVMGMGHDGGRKIIAKDLAPYDSMMTHALDPQDMPEILGLRERMRGWRFYDHMRTDRDAPARRAQVGTHTPVLASDGADLPAAIQTILEIGDGPAFDRALDDAFPGSRVRVVADNGVFDIEMTQPGLLRPMRSAELSDGTLRYLLLLTAMMSPRPPALMVLNEPESSLHPDLLPPMARLIVQQASVSQVIVVTHAAVLVAEMERAEGARVYWLEKDLGETQIQDAEDVTWAWPQR